MSLLKDDSLKSELEKLKAAKDLFQFYMDAHNKANEKEKVDNIDTNNNNQLNINKRKSMDGELEENNPNKNAKVEENKQEDDEALCVICLNNKKNVLLLPCKYVSYLVLFLKSFLLGICASATSVQTSQIVLFVEWLSSPRQLYICN
jgi:hypothetical protein